MSSKARYRSVVYGCECEVSHRPKACQNTENSGKKKIIIPAKYSLVRQVKIPFGSWFILNLRIKTEETKKHLPWPECASN